MVRRALQRISEGDDVLVVTNPPSLPMLVAIAAKQRRARLTLLVHDVYPQVLVAAGVTSSTSVLARAVQRMSDFVYRRADRIVVLGRDMNQLIASRLGTADASKVVIIPNWGDVEEIQPLPRRANPVLQRLGIDTAFVVQLMGTIGRTHGVDTLVDAATILREDTGIRFLVIGGGAKRPWLEQEVARRGLTNVHILDKVPWSDMAVHLAACDVSVIPYMARMEGVSVPSRMYNVMASGRPIIAAAGAASEVARVVTEERIGWVVPAGDAEALADAIQLARAGAPLDRLGERSRAASGRYTGREAIARYVTLFSA